MKIEVVRHRYEKIVEVVEINPIDKKIYLWHNGIRRSYKVKPVWTDWRMELDNEPEEIFRYSILTVDPWSKLISLGDIHVHDLPNIIKDEKNPHYRLAHDILYYSDDLDSVRTKEQFEKDYNSVLNLFQYEFN